MSIKLWILIAVVVIPFFLPGGKYRGNGIFSLGCGGLFFVLGWFALMAWAYLEHR